MNKKEIDTLLKQVVRVYTETGIKYPLRIVSSRGKLNGFIIKDVYEDRITGFPYEGGWRTPGDTRRQMGQSIFVLKQDIMYISCPYLELNNTLDLRRF